MSQNYRPGTVVTATVRRVPNTRAIRTTSVEEGESMWVTPNSITGWRTHIAEDVTDVRPLVVLDLSEVQRGALVRLLRDDNFSPFSRQESTRIADEIEALTPRPDEPTGLGAVVEVDGGVRFVRLPDGMWTSEDESQPWHHLNVVRVLSEGVAR